jgi:hypothetical protein
MSNFYKTIACKNLLLSDGNINQKKGSLCLSLNGQTVIEIRNNDAFLNSKKILTSVAETYSVINFGSGIYTNNGLKYLRYRGNGDSGYDKNLRVANVFNIPFSIIIKQISIQKGSSGENIINIPAINYSKKIIGNFFTFDLDFRLLSNTKLYVEIDGEPSLETFVDLYYTKDSNSESNGLNDPKNNIILSEEIIPVFNEIFDYDINVVSTTYPLLFK